MINTCISYNVKDLNKILLRYHQDKEDVIYSILTSMITSDDEDANTLIIHFGLMGPMTFEGKYELVITRGNNNSVPRFTPEESPLGMKFIQKLNDLYIL